MANTKSAIKRIRRISKQTVVNKARKSRYKNALKKMNALIESKKKAEALNFLPKLNSEFNFGKKAKASFLFFSSKITFIFLIAFLNLLFLDLLTIVCLDILLILLIADFVFAIRAMV